MTCAWLSLKFEISQKKKTIKNFLSLLLYLSQTVPSLMSVKCVRKIFFKEIIFAFLNCGATHAVNLG